MDLNLLLEAHSINPHDVIVMRHRPKEPKLAKVIGWLAAEKPEVFNAYQQTQGEKVEKVMCTLVNKGYVASFVAQGAGKALFVGIYSIGDTTSLSFSEYWEIPAYEEMSRLGMEGFKPTLGRDKILWFDMQLTEYFAEWKGKLIISWPGNDRSWWRRAERNVMPILAITEESQLDSAMPSWDEIDFSWEELNVLPSRWRIALSQWRGIYFIFDEADSKGYIGSAYGEENIYGRWSNYATTGHGGNSLLKKRDPRKFRFTILQRVSPDMDSQEVLRLEATWKARLHTRQPHGLNEN